MFRPNKILGIETEWVDTAIDRNEYETEDGQRLYVDIVDKRTGEISHSIGYTYIGNNNCWERDIIRFYEFLDYVYCTWVDIFGEMGKENFKYVFRDADTVDKEIEEKYGNLADELLF